uniref:Uncharacterized protein n=2 Tax=Oncorhynchus TaxID=8016 RepID=A0A8C7IYA4_ONCKI
MEESEEVQEITLTLSPRPSGMGDGGREGDEGMGDQEVEEAVSPASEVSTLSVPELQVKVGSEGMSKIPPFLCDYDDVLDSDPLREKKEMAFAQNYLNRVCHALQEVPGRVKEFLEVLYEFEQDGDEHTSVELFTRLKPVLNEWPELLRDFAAFLHLEQAQDPLVCYLCVTDSGQC